MVGNDFVTTGHQIARFDEGKFPAPVVRAGEASMFAYEEFFQGEIRNENTRRAYTRHVHRFLEWCEMRDLELAQVRPGDVSAYMDDLRVSVPSKHQVRAGLNHFFDFQVRRHAVILNPVTSVRNEKFEREEGKTPMILPHQVKALFESIDTTKLVGLRDRAVLATIGYTAARVGAVSKLRLKDLLHNGEQYKLLYQEKRGKQREIPVRHDLEKYLFEYLTATNILEDPKEWSLFRTFDRKRPILSSYWPRAGKRDLGSMSENAIQNMMRRRLKDTRLMMGTKETSIGYSPTLTPHSFRVAIATDLLENQGVPLEEVQYLLGHSDPRTTRLYIRSKKKVSRNLVERISY